MARSCLASPNLGQISDSPFRWCWKEEAHSSQVITVTYLDIMSHAQYRAASGIGILSFVSVSNLLAQKGGIANSSPIILSVFFKNCSKCL